MRVPRAPRVRSDRCGIGEQLGRARAPRSRHAGRRSAAAPTAASTCWDRPVSFTRPGRGQLREIERLRELARRSDVAGPEPVDPTVADVDLALVMPQRGRHGRRTSRRRKIAPSGPSLISTGRNHGSRGRDRRGRCPASGTRSVGRTSLMTTWFAADRRRRVPW